MAALSDYLEAQLLEWFFRGATYTPPATVHIALFTSDPTDAGTGSEVSTAAWTNYARLTLARGTAAYTANADDGSGGKKVDNVNLLDFGTAAIVSPVTVTHIGVLDPSENLLWHGPLGDSKTINNNDPVRFPANSLKFSFR